MTLYRSLGAIFAFVPFTSAVGSELILPTPGCYQVDWSMRDVMSANGEMQRIQTASVDGATGNSTHTIEAAGGQGFTTKAVGRGPFYKTFATTGASVRFSCLSQSTYDGANGFDIMAVCKNAVLDPAKLKFTRIASPVEKWRIEVSGTGTYQIGLNNLPSAQNNTLDNLEETIAAARPRTEEERKQLRSQQEAIKKIKADMQQNAPEMERLLRDIETKAANGSPEERAAAQSMLTGPVTQHQFQVIEEMTWSGSQCPAE
jgi:hypothetical protein